MENRLRKERERLIARVSGDVKPDGLGTVQFLVKCPGNASTVLRNAVGVLAVVAEHYEDEWPTLTDWMTILPRWFIDRCGPEMSREQAEQLMAHLRGLSQEDRDRSGQERRWSVAGWLHWMMPGNRTWTWWDGCEIDANTLAVAIEVDEWPFPWGAFRWLLIAAGASSVASE